MAYNNDRVAKPAKGRYFPVTAAELFVQVQQFAVFSLGYRERIWFLMENCAVETPLGHQLCSFLPMSYLAVFSLPEPVPPAVAKKGVAIALERFREIDKGPALATREHQFVMYRAFLGPMGVLSITQHIIHGGPRPYQRFREMSQLPKSCPSPDGQRELCRVQIVSPLFD